MDLNSIQEYLDYTPYLGDPRVLLDEILQQANYLSRQQKDEVIRAYTYANKHHEGVKRLSWEEYIVHPVRVMEFLMEIKPDVPSMQTALLHDVIEDTPVTYEDVLEDFGQEVADLCEGLVKVSKVRYKWQDRQLETLKKTFLAMWKDLRVIIIKIADRVHNIQTLHYHPKPEKRERIADETLKVFVPIAKRLWLYVYQWYLENGSFKILEPKEFSRIVNYVRKQYGDVDMYTSKWLELLSHLCQQEQIECVKIDGRLKSPHRIWKKLKKYQTNDIAKIMDILAFRIVADSVGDCYNMLGIIHKYYTPIFSKMKDYIALPKPNGYKSLHTTVLGMFNFPVEIQVRTDEMDQIANYGVAAHYAYSDANRSVTVSEKQAYWIEKMQEIVKKYQASPDKGQFKDELDIEILQKNIFVYTPKWDIIELPMRSTILDFAFRVHTDIWLKFKNAFVNGRIVPIDHTLKTGDIVDIHTFKNKFSATSSWLKSLHTPSAKAKLNRFVRQEQRDSIVKEVSDRINERLKEYDLPLLWWKEDLIGKKWKWEEFDRLLLRIRDRQLSITKLIREVYKDSLHELLQDVEKPKKEISHHTSDVEEKKKHVVVDIDKDIDVVYCPVCDPQPDDKIIARTWKDGIKIHKTTCDAMLTLDYKKLLEAHRKWELPSTYILRLTIDAYDKPWVLLKILNIFEFLNINLKDIHTWTAQKEWITKVTFDLEFINPSKMYYTMKELQEKKQLLKIGKKEIL